MWVMPSSSARCAQLPRAADKVPFYAALKKFRDYLNGLVPEYDESDYVFNDPKYNAISIEAELKEDNLAFTTINESGEVIAMPDPNKKKRGRPKKVRGENGEEIPTPRKKKEKDENLDGADDDPSKKKRGRPKKPKDGSAPSAPRKRSNKKAAPESVPSIEHDMNSISSNIQNSSSPNHNLSSLPPNTNTNGSNSNSFLPPMESPSANNSSNANSYQTGPMNSSPPSDANHCFQQSLDHQVAPPEISPHQTYQRPASNQQLFNSAEEISGEIGNDPISSPVAASPSLAPSDFEPPQPASVNNSEMNPFSQQQQTTVDHSHHLNSPLAQTHSPLGMYQQQSSQSMPHHHQMMNSPTYSPYSRQPQAQQQQSYMQSAVHQQQTTQAPNVHSSKQQMTQMNGVTTDIYKDVAAKSLSGLESLVEQIPNINEQDALGSLAQSTGHSQNGKKNSIFIL
jgi:TDG/mug DNA glycosylase family protein